jgi:cyclopropane-fatty-acyl-phospholipid synthase
LAGAAGWKRPPIPPEEVRLHGSRHSKTRDAAAIAHHYDVSNDFYRIVLGPSMTYSCAVWDDDTPSVDEAQANKYELICRKLALQPGMRLLDVGCGWGGMVRYAAEHYGAHAVGVTLSRKQAEYAIDAVKRARLDDRVEIRVQDYRDVHDGPFDAVSSIGMFEHVGAAKLDEYFGALFRLVTPGGRLLNHGIARLRHGDPEAGPFSERYVFPDAAPLHLSRIAFALEGAGVEITHVEGFRQDYAETLRHWAQRFDGNLPEAIRLGGEERVRVWRLYLRAARRGFESGFLSVFQVLGRRPD